MGQPKGHHEAEIKVACIQMEPIVGQKEVNLKRSIELLEAAAAQGAKLVVLPELCNSGYVFKDRAEAFALSEDVPNGPTTQAWMAVAKKHDLYIVAGICEREDNLLYNSAAIVGPDGHIGTFRKLHLWNEENLFFEPGNNGMPVFATPLGRIACNICYDSWFPESFRLAALQGADIVCVPTNWVPIPGQKAGERAMANILIMAAAHCNSVFIAAADRIGTERGQPFEGQSLIVSYTGWPIGDPASKDKEEILYADINLAEARRKRNWNEFNQPLRDRRVDFYDEMLGSPHERGWY